MNALGDIQPVPTGPTRDHASYFGASDAPALLGISPYRTALDVWAEKTGRVRFEGNDATEAGDEFERPILGMYQRKAGCEIEFTGTLFHPELDHIGATPDAIRDRKRTVQVKFVGYGQAWRWGSVEDGPEGVPPELIAQVHQEAALARLTLGIPAEVAEVVAQIGTERRVYEIPIDHEFGESIIVLGDDFWTTHVVADVMPEVVDGGDMDTLRAIFPTQRSGAQPGLAPEHVIELAKHYDAQRKAESAAKQAKEHTGAQLCAIIGDGAGFVAPLDGLSVRWPMRDGKVSWVEVAKRYRDLAVRLGASGAECDAIVARFTGEKYRQIDVRVKG